MSVRQTPAPGISVEIDALHFGYPRGGHRLVDVSLSMREGEICCLLGPNGAGKTTLLKCLLNLLTPKQGTIRVHGQAITALSARELARLVAYVPQSASTPFVFTAADLAVMGRTPYLPLSATPSAADQRMAQSCLERLGIGHLRDRPFSELSGGERQLVLLARALVQQAPVLVLDEPTAALDYGNEVRLLGIIADLARDGRSVLMTTHQPNHALNYSTRAVLMRNGAITADGAPAEVITSERLTALYEAPIFVAAVVLPAEMNRELRVCIPLRSRQAP
jgi:ABC-type cobalamin/Fe3+-siderophores transport system ATPase subunit